ncbi:MAG: hypothetical protein OIN86_10365 [Candidatus Methanoperedens sp.]|nr:hypothetical protein [Candidatus Methanoperedens sp.]CAG0971586.1 hypothetical protein METP1_01273 [Methanosarcinales archaeon]
MVVITTLKKIGIDAINKKWRNATESVIESLGDIYIKALESDVLLSSDVGRAVGYAIKDLVEVSLKEELEFTVEYIAKPIKKICLRAIEKAESKPNFQKLMTSIDINLIKHLEYIGKKTLEREREYPRPETENIIRLLIEIGIKIVKIRTNQFDEQLIRKHIISIFRQAFDNRKEEILIGSLINPILNLGLEISAKYTKYGFYAEPEEIKKLDIKSKNDIEIEYKWIIDLLGEIGKNTNEKSLSDAIKDVGESIIAIGGQCEKYEILKAAEHAAKTLEDLGFVSRDRPQ